VNITEKHYLKSITWKFNDSSKTYPEVNHNNIHITSPSDVYNNFRFLFDSQVKERFVVIWLSSSNNIIGFEIISEGILNCSVVHPREVFRGAIVATCNSIIIAHNHPSGNPEPSNEDINITKQLVETGKIIGIPVYDHIIFADNKYTSFIEANLI
jgi:DNA repair protein RadC